MSILDQNDIDALLASANELASEAGEGEGGGGSSAQKPRQPVHVNLKELQRILHLRFPVIVNLADRRLPFEDLLKLTPGSIIEFERASDSEPDLYVGNRKIGRGQAVKVGEYFGLRVTEIDPLEDRIRALGQ
ncbi:MAG TPA: FliM/FliN family flagellar motor C-terminal domain-containing protein [Phycisphaerae bacterium]|nr:FliM/FliN family flagellar motor C-terminal domain-containing protein [Phycisphaerae bacterium]